MLAQTLPDVVRQEILVIKSSITQRGMTWKMTSSWTPETSLLGLGPDSAFLKLGLVRAAGPEDVSFRPHTHGLV